VGLERGPLSLMNTTEELLGRNSSGCGLEDDHGDPLCWPRYTFYPQKLALTSPTSGGRSVGIVCLQAKATEFFFFCFTFILPCIAITHCISFYSTAWKSVNLLKMAESSWNM
jgi:hypothetical protein